MSTKRVNPSCRPGTTDAMQRLADENEALRAERDQATEAVQKLTEGVPFGEIVGMHTIANMERSIKALTSERDGLVARDERLTNCIDTVRDLIMLLDEDCFGTGHRQDCQPWSIRDEVLDGMNKLMNETPAKSLAHIRAAGAREALERAMQSPGFSDTVVRVDLMREIIEQMEAGG